MRSADVSLSFGSLATAPIGGVILAAGCTTRKVAGDNSIAPVYHEAPTDAQHDGTDDLGSRRQMARIPEPGWCSIATNGWPLSQPPRPPIPYGQSRCP